MAELPYEAEYAKSNRSCCKGCFRCIDKGTLRIAVRVQSKVHDGKLIKWHHVACFFEKHRPKSEKLIDKWNLLRNEDKKIIKKAIGFSIPTQEPMKDLTNSSVVNDQGTHEINQGASTSKDNYSGIGMPVEKGSGTKRANGDASPGALNDFKIKYSKSGGATCDHCEDKIWEGAVKISKMVFDKEISHKYGGQPLWHHVKCFAEARSSLLYFAGGEDLPGFESLSKRDQDMIKKELRPMKCEELPCKKVKKQPKDDKELKEEELVQQDKLFAEYRDLLNDLKKKDLKEILEANSQSCDHLSSVDECRNFLADVMAFGALDPCPKCNGQLTLSNVGYKCTGHEASGWAQCSYLTRKPKRNTMKVPDKYQESPTFKKYEAKIGVRLFEFELPPPNTKKEEPQNKKIHPITPCKNIEFFLFGDLKESNEGLVHRINQLGGLVVGELTDTTAVVVSTKTAVKEMNSKMQEIKQKDIMVVESSFFDLIDPLQGSVTKTLELIKEHNIANWGSDPANHVPRDILDGKPIPKSGSIYAQSGSKKHYIKGGTVVDPDSKLEAVAHVYKGVTGKKYYTTYLCKTDVAAHKNSYYKMQVLEADNLDKYWLFKGWGKIGTKIGNTSLVEKSSVDDAIQEFRDVFKKETKNDWTTNLKKIRKKPNAYFPIEMDYEDVVEAAKAEKYARCELALPVQKLVEQIFDIDIMKRTLLEFELDAKMPLGKLSKTQIKEAYKVLSDLTNGQASQDMIQAATNKFYTLIPHNCGVHDPPLLDNEEIIKSKSEMLDSLLGIKIAYNLLKTDTDDATSPIETHYLQLKAEILPLDKTSPEFQMILKYATNTHAETHTDYTLDIEQVFKVVRDGEDERYAPFKKLHNRRLLFHGSRITNFVGILSQGMRIAPSEAPPTGYMFGRGIYFADMVSKAANYSMPKRKDNQDGLLLLCEVALGDMLECRQAKYVKKLPAGKHSTWGQGRSEPDPRHTLVLDCGTQVPLGTPVKKGFRSALLYNEFIVYDIAQVNVKYLLQIKFNYK